MKLLCVCGRRRREEEAPGIQNQKQEPHTKMWGKRSRSSYNNTIRVVETILMTAVVECP